MLAAAAEVSADRRAVDLAEAVIEAVWQLLCYLNSNTERHLPRRRARPPRARGG